MRLGVRVFIVGELLQDEPSLLDTTKHALAAAALDRLVVDRGCRLLPRHARIKTKLLRFCEFNRALEVPHIVELLVSGEVVSHSRARTRRPPFQLLRALRMEALNVQKSLELRCSSGLHATSPGASNDRRTRGTALAVQPLHRA